MAATGTELVTLAQLKELKNDISRDIDIRHVISTSTTTVPAGQVSGSYTGVFFEREFNSAAPIIPLAVKVTILSGRKIGSQIVWFGDPLEMFVSQFVRQKQSVTSTYKSSSNSYYINILDLSVSLLDDANGLQIGWMDPDVTNSTPVKITLYYLNH